jgi:two-component system sensor histidine kinase NreB
MAPLHDSSKITEYIIQAQEAELKRIALSLHEGIAQSLYSTMSHIQLIQQCEDPLIVQQCAQEALNTTERTIEELRWIATELHPSTLEDFGLSSALKSYQKIFTSTFGILVDIENIGKQSRLPKYIETALFRICQETLQNSAKYADSDRIHIRLNWQAESLNITLQDYGRGFDLQEVEKAGKTLGIAAMKQRTLLLNGTFQIASSTGEGTTVTVSVPIE